MLSPTDSPINWFSLLALILEYSLAQSCTEWNWRFWSHCPGWCSEGEQELDNTGVSNYPGTILTYKQSVMGMIWLSWVTVVPVWQWSLCGLLVLWWLVLETTVTFLTVLLVEAIPASQSCQYTSNRNMEFVHRLCFLTVLLGEAISCHYTSVEFVHTLGHTKLIPYFWSTCWSIFSDLCNRM